MNGEPNLIIIADDDSDDILFFLTALLSRPIELTVITVPNGERLIEILEAVSPNFIFLDINMPKKNGFESLKVIRSEKKTNQPTVIMCSTSNAGNDLKISQELGADMYVVKPNNVEHLGKMIDEIFKRDWTGKAKERMPEKFLLTHVQ